MLSHKTDGSGVSVCGCVHRCVVCVDSQEAAPDLKVLLLPSSLRQLLPQSLEFGLSPLLGDARLLPLLPVQRQLLRCVEVLTADESKVDMLYACLVKAMMSLCRLGSNRSLSVQRLFLCSKACEKNLTSPRTPAGPNNLLFVFGAFT